MLCLSGVVLYSRWVPRKLGKFTNLSSEIDRFFLPGPCQKLKKKCKGLSSY